MYNLYIYIYYFLDIYISLVPDPENNYTPPPPPPPQTMGTLASQILVSKYYFQLEKLELL